MDSWEQIVLSFNIKPLVQSEGKFLGEVQGSFNLIYAPSRDMMKIDNGFSCFAKGVGNVSLYYAPSLDALREGMNYYLSAQSKTFSSKKDLGRILDIASSRLPEDCFSPRDIHIAG